MRRREVRESDREITIAMKVGEKELVSVGKMGEKEKAYSAMMRKIRAGE